MAGFFFSSRRRHTRLTCDWSSDVCSSDLYQGYEHWRKTLKGHKSGGHIQALRGALLTTELLAVAVGTIHFVSSQQIVRSEERRVGKECRSRWRPCYTKKSTERTYC